MGIPKYYRRNPYGSFRHGTHVGEPGESMPPRTLPAMDHHPDFRLSPPTPSARTNDQMLGRVVRSRPRATDEQADATLTYPGCTLTEGCPSDKHYANCAEFFLEIPLISTAASPTEDDDATDSADGDRSTGGDSHER